MTIVNVNGIPAETGCYVAGDWGHYGPDHLAERAEEFGWRPEARDDPRHWRLIAEAAEERGEVNHSYWENHIEAGNDILDWLNDHTATMCVTCGAAISWADDANSTLDEPQWVHVAWGEHEEPIVPRRFIWHWHDGEVFLSPICDDPDTCDDDTCAHWD